MTKFLAYFPLRTKLDVLNNFHLGKFCSKRIGVIWLLQVRYSKARLCFIWIERKVSLVRSRDLNYQDIFFFLKSRSQPFSSSELFASGSFRDLVYVCWNFPIASFRAVRLLSSSEKVLSVTKKEAALSDSFFNFSDSNQSDF